jgi:hypothetical protein
MSLFNVGDYVQLGFTTLLVALLTVVGFVTDITVARWVCFATAAVFATVQILFVIRLKLISWKNPFASLKK